MKRTVQYQGQKQQSGFSEPVSDALAIEHPLRISLNGKVITLTMQTPGDETDLARGILFAEGMYKHRHVHPEFHVTERSEQGHISSLEVRVPEELIDAAQLNKRNLLSVASCGICGKTELPALHAPQEKANGFPNILLEPDFLQQLYADMKDAQELFHATGGVHGAGIYTSAGERLSVKEDIGRHNAVDKAIGYLLQQERLADAYFLLCSGRISYEIVTKCFIAGIPVLCAVSAPSSLAVDFCKELGVVLLAFCREGRFTRYA